MKTRALVLILLCSALAGSARPVAAGWYTPLPWRQVVEPRVNRALAGQHKNVNWIRDRNHDFVDDLIDSVFTSTDTADVILDLNRWLTPREIGTRFGRFGHVRYVGRVLTTALLDGVVVSRMDSLASQPEVAMVEWQVPIHPEVVYSERQIQARKGSYYPISAESLGKTGVGVKIAIVDTGVDDGHRVGGVWKGHEGIPEARYGFDAVAFTDVDGDGIDDSCEGPPLGDGDCTGADDEPGDGSKNPDPCPSGGTCAEHGTLVAGIALGRGYDDPTDKCAGPTTPDDEKGLTSNCVGAAPGADLVDIRVCDSDTDCKTDDVNEGLDWLALNATSKGIRVANLSFAVCADDDPSGMINSLVDFIAESGVVMVAAHGNNDRCLASNPACDASDPDRRSMAPGSASMAITVAAVNDNNQFDRKRDDTYDMGLHGPRCDFNPATPDYSGLKPDVSAPGYGIWSATAGTVHGYHSASGTSMAAPHVAGIAAILLQANPALDPANLADLIRRTAEEPSVAAVYDSAIDPIWSTTFGYGVVNAAAALQAMNTSDVSFPTCAGDPGQPGAPCLLASPRQAWENDADITLDVMPPVTGVPNRIHAAVKNGGASPVTVDVDFGVYIFGAGTPAFDNVGRQRATIPAGATQDVVQDWTPSDEGHECAQVAIRYGLDTIFWNNVTQRNLTILPSSTITASAGAGHGAEGMAMERDVRVENPFFAPAAFRVETASSRPDMPCTAIPDHFANDPSRDPAQEVRVSFAAGKLIGDSADCRVAVWARRTADKSEREIGGVTVRAFEPSRCPMEAVVLDAKGKGVSGVRVSYARAIRPGTASFAAVARRARSGHDGRLRLDLESGIPYRFRLSRGTTEPVDRVVVPRCGAGMIALQLQADDAARPRDPGGRRGR